jgi:hypothetical protein
METLEGLSYSHSNMSIPLKIILYDMQAKNLATGNNSQGMPLQIKTF